MPSDRVEDYGLDSEGHVRDTSGFDRFLDDHPEWADHAGQVMSYDAAILAWDAGLGTPDNWEGITILGRDDGSDEGYWQVQVVDTETGEVLSIDLGHYYDLAWDYYNAGDYYGYDVEKDIDTGGPSD